MKIYKKIILIALILCLCFTMASCDTEEQESGSVVEPEEVAMGDETITISLNEMIELGDKSWTFSELYTRLFPDYVVYSDSKSMLHYVPVNKENKMASYDYSKVSYDDNGYMFYDITNETQQSWRGIDVSSYQGYIDWSQVAKSGISYAFIRIGYRGYTQGKLVLDDYCTYNIENAIANGINVGVYFVTQAISEQEAIEEANFVLDVIKDYNITWPIVYDVEGNSADDARAKDNTSEQNTAQIIAFCETIKAAGKTPMIYSNTRWFVSEMDLAQLQNYDLWFAYYKETPYFPYEYKIWQYSQSGRVNGIYGDVDLNISFVNYGEK